MANFKPPTVGELRHKVIFQQLVSTPDGMGGTTGTWQDVLSTWVRMSAWKGKEVLSSNQPATSAWFEVAMRYRPNITPDMRIIEPGGDKVGRWYNIRFVNDPDQRRRWLQLSVEAIKQP